MQATRKAAPRLKAHVLGLATLAALGLSAALPQAAPAQTTVTWTGSGQSGTDPYGQTWFYQFDPVPTRYYRQLPLLVPSPWQGPDQLTEFDITFTGLPAGVVVTPSYNGNDTQLYNGTKNDFWDATQTGADAYQFTAPAGKLLSPGDRFFAFVAFTGDPANSAFTAHYNGGTPAAVPEPSTVAPFAVAGLGLLGLTLRARRQSKAA